LHVAGLHLLDSESRSFEDLIYRSIQMASAGDPFPERSKAILPAADSGGGRTTMLDEEQPAICFEHATHFSQSAHDVRDRAERPRTDYRVDAVIFERDRFCRALQQLD
jgi:hypothetical protein